MADMKLESFDEMFGGDLEQADIERSSVKEIEINSLVPFRNHPFSLYEGDRLEEMKESITELGVLVPILIRPLEDGTYEILSGHNRTNAAMISGLNVVPAIIKEGLTDEEATLIVTETNLIQRSFTDLKHSEKAAVIAVRYKAMKCQGIRKDLISEIADLQSGETCAPEGHKIKSREKLGEEYSLSKNSIARYLRVNKLIEEFKNRLDEGELSIRAGVELSYLTLTEQKKLFNITTKMHYKVDMKVARQIRTLKEVGKFENREISGIFEKKTTRSIKDKVDRRLSVPYTEVASIIDDSTIQDKDLVELILNALRVFVKGEKRNEI